MRLRSIYLISRLFIIIFLLTINSRLILSGEQGHQILLQSKNSGGDISALKEAQRSIRLGTNWLRKQQQEDGSWCSSPLITGLVIIAILGEETSIEQEPPRATVSKGIRFILKEVNNDGSIGPYYLQPRSTSVCVIAFIVARAQECRGAIKNGRRYLTNFQYSQPEDYQPKDTGGIKTARKGKIDIFSIQVALDALHLSAHPKRDITLKMPYYKIIKFLEQCQNLKTTNDLPWTSNDGGFHSEPIKSSSSRSQVCSTYAGLTSLLNLGFNKNDVRVKSAYRWIRSHYPLIKLKTKRLGFYYYLMAKALNAYGNYLLNDSKGHSHNWRTELIEKLVSLQNGEGYWANNDERKETKNVKVSSTAYCLLALEIACAGY